MAIEVIINDSSCLIDLRKGGLLAATLRLPIRFVVALPLVSAELHDFSAAAWADLRAQGLTVIDLDSGQVSRAFALKGRFPGLSAYDCFSLALAETTANAMLLTGDRQLRRRAVDLGVAVHGILWACDEIERNALLDAAALADALDRLLADPLVFVPAGEIRNRIARLRQR